VLKPGDNMTKQLVLRSKDPFPVTSIRCEGESLKLDARYDDAAKPFHLIPVTFAAGEQSGKVSTVVRIAVNGEDASLQVPVHAVVTP
jgi:hypothetical protein